MWRFLCLGMAFLLAVFPAAGGETSRRLVPLEEAPQYRAIGRLNVAGRRFCSATLVSPQLVITAAHCLFHPQTQKRVPLSEFRFVAGLYKGEYSALRRVRRAAILPDFVFEQRASLDGVGSDLGIVELAEPISGEEAVPFELSLPPRSAAPLTIVSYARDRSQAPSIQELCRVPLVRDGVVAVDCEVNYGASGAPVLADFAGHKRLIAVVSAMGEASGGRGVTLAVIAAPRLEELRLALGASAWPKGR